MGVVLIGGYIVLSAAALIALLLSATIVIAELWGDDMSSRREAIDR